MMPMQPQPPMPPQKKGMSGCMIAFIVVSIVGLITAIVFGVAIYLVVTSKAGKTAFKVIGESTKIAQKGMTAPGTPELRALGCQTAMVVDLKDMNELMNDLLDGGPDASHLDGLIVTCDLPSRAAAIACDDVAKTYVSAVGGTATANFVVTVKHHDNSRALCESTYDDTGTFLATGSKLR
jgi:hypothetical protein